MTSGIMKWLIMATIVMCTAWVSYAQLPTEPIPKDLIIRADILSDCDSGESGISVSLGDILVYVLHFQGVPNAIVQDSYGETIRAGIWAYARSHDGQLSHDSPIDYQFIIGYIDGGPIAEEVLRIIVRPRDLIHGQGYISIDDGQKETECPAAFRILDLSSDSSPTNR